jgi:LmbE family N-acetylglucosaminyl deacetylase
VHLGMAILLTLAPLALGMVVVTALLRRPRVVDGEARHALILAAHQDDCAILAGGYAIFARAAGRSVRIAYLTCGAASPDLPRAKTRRQEAYTAWGMLAIPAEDIFFCDLPEHAPSSVSSWSVSDRDRARGWLLGLLRDLPVRSVVFLPAPGETHVDHRALRQLALEAWKVSERVDLSFFEGPEYNDYLSLVQAPEKMVVTLASALPVLSGWAKRRARASWAGFASRGSYWELPPDRVRSEQRRELLRAFASENGELLVRLFGWCERYRPVPDAECGLQAEPPAGYLYLGQYHRGFSALLALVVLAEGAGLLSAMVCGAALRCVHGAWWMRAAVVGATVCAGALGSRPNAILDTRVFYLALTCGAFLASVGVP